MNSIKALLHAAYQYFYQRQRHEQWLLLSVAMLLFIYLLYLLAWQPVSQAKHTQTINHHLALEKRVAVQHLANEYQQLEGSQVNHRPNTGENLTQTIDRSIAKHQLVMTRFQPSSSGDVQIRFDNALFNHLIAWLYDIETNDAIGVKEVSIRPSTHSGYVDASIRLYRDVP